MDFFKTEAVVLATIDFGNANRVVTFFTREYGKIEANAYGCRRMKSHLSGAMQMFNHLSLEFVRGSMVYRVNEADIINFYKINDDLTRLAYASLFFEIVNKMTIPEQTDENVFYLLLKSLETFEKRNPRITALISACQFLKTTGFALEYPQNMQSLFSTFINFDWQDQTKMILKANELEKAEKIFFDHVQSIIESPLNSLNFLKLINSV